MQEIKEDRGKMDGRGPLVEIVNGRGSECRHDGNSIAILCDVDEKDGDTLTAAGHFAWMVETCCRSMILAERRKE